MRPVALISVGWLALASLLCGSSRAAAQGQGNGQGAARPGRIAVVPPGVGFYNPRNQSPGFTPYPQAQPYNSVSFYGRSYNPRGFSPYFNGEPYYPPGMTAPSYAAPLITIPPPETGPNGATYTHYRYLIPGFSYPVGGGLYNGLDFYPPGMISP
jgi:hypothetical protein